MLHFWNTDIDQLSKKTDAIDTQVKRKEKKSQNFAISEKKTLKVEIKLFQKVVKTVRFISVRPVFFTGNKHCVLFCFLNELTWGCVNIPSINDALCRVM